MSGVLEGLKDRLESAKGRLVSAQQGFQAAQVELQAATVEFNIWSSAVNLETREEEKRLAEARERQLPMDLPEPPATLGVEVPQIDDGHLVSTSSVVTVNKTEKVREALREHAAGITPSGLWTEVKDHFSSRAYLYSVLKRLRDSDEVFIRRGRYVLRPKQDDVKATGEGAATIQ